MFGGDMLFKDYRQNGDKNNERLLFNRVENPLSTFAVVNIFLAQNVGSNPIVVERFFGVGFINVLIASGVAWLVAQYSFNVFIKTWHYDSETSYSECLARSIGKKWKGFTRLLFMLSLNIGIFYNLLDIPIYWHLFTDFYHIKSGILDNSKFDIYFFTLCFSFPFLFLHDLSSFKWISYISNFSFLIISCICFVIMIQSIKKNGFDPEGKTVLFTPDLSGTVNCLSAFVYPFFIHPIMCSLGSECQEITQKGLVKISFLSNLASLLITLIDGYICWFVLYGTSNGGLSLVKFDQSHLTAIAALLSLFHILVTVSITSYLIGFELTKIFLGNVKTYCSNALGSLIALLLPLGVVLLPESFYDYFGSVCQLSFLITGLIFPLCSFLKMYGCKSCIGVKTIVVLVVVTALGIGSIILIFTRTTER